MARRSTTATARRRRSASAVVRSHAEPSRVQPRLEQRFVGVDVADAGHDALIEQHRLEAALRSRASGRASTPPAGRTAPAPGRTATKKSSSACRVRNSVALPKRRMSRKRKLLLAVVEGEDQVRVRGDRRRGRRRRSVARSCPGGRRAFFRLRVRRGSTCRAARHGSMRWPATSAFQAGRQRVRRACRLAACTAARRRPTRQGRRSRTTVSTSGNSGTAHLALGFRR